jgi:hypothetical protein
MDQNSYLIENSPTLSLTVSQPSNVTTFSISSSLTSVSQMASLSFIFQTANFIPVGAILELIFPNDLPISQLTLSSVIGISKIEPVVNYTISGQTVRMTNAISVYYSSSDVHYFRLTSIQNPPSTKPTGMFQFTIYTQNNYVMYSLKTNVTYTATPGSFNNVSVLQGNSLINQQTQYTFSFIPTDNISAGGYIKLTFPSELTINDITQAQCTGIISGLSNTSICQITNKVLTITNGFPNIFQPATISFAIDGVANYYCVKETSSFGIVSYSSDNYTIDSLNVGVTATFKEGSLINPQIIPSSFKNYDITDYNIKFTTQNSLPLNSKILISFPPQYDLDPQKSAQCSIQEGNLNGATTCNIDNQSITISLDNETALPSKSSINITIPAVRNNRSIKPSDTFTLLTVTSDGYNIDKNKNDLTVTNTELANIDTVTITPNDLTTGDITTYIFSLQLSTFITNTDIIKITLPQQLGISVNNNISVIGIKDLSTAQLQNTISNNQGLNTISITATLQPGKKQSSSIQFQIQNLRNPISLKPTDLFTVSITTSDLYDIEQYTQPLSVTMTTPNILKETFVKATVTQSNSISDYIVQFMPYNTIPKGGVILVEYPLEYIISDVSCIANIGFPGLITCTSDPNIRQIKIQDAFVSSDYSPSLLQFTITGLKNRMNENQTTTGTFKIYTKTQDNYSIDYKLDGLNIIFTNKVEDNGVIECEENCLVCEGPLKTCLKCIDGMVIDNGLCVEPAVKCNDGLYLNNGLCVPCSNTMSHCSLCSDKDCFQCEFNYLLQGNKCVDNCDNGFYKIEKSCERCLPSCKTCLETSANCTSCYDGYFIFNKRCINICPSGMYFNKLTCASCNNNCDLCNSDEICLQCDKGYYNHMGICYATCPYGYSQDNISQTCKQSIQNIPLGYPDTFKLPVTNFLGIIGVVLISFIIYCIKVHEPQTYYYGSAIPFLAILTFIYNLALIYYVFNYGVPIYFSILMISIIMGVVLNNAFIIVYDYYTTQDTEFIYWKSSRKCISAIFFILAYLIDYKIIRLFYSRLNRLEYFSAKFKNYRRIHYPYRTLVIVEFICVTLPMAGLCIYTLITTQAFIDIWWLALESFIMAFIFSLFKIADLIVNKNLNEDYYNQQKDHPDILPYSYMYGSDGKLKIQKKFDFNARSKEDYSFSSRTCLKKSIVPDNSCINNDANSNINDISFRGRGEKDNNNKLKYKLDGVDVKRYTDDTNINDGLNNTQFKTMKLSNIRRSLIKTKNAFLRGEYDIRRMHEKEKKSNNKSSHIIEKLSSGIKNMIKLISPTKKEVSKFNDKEYRKLNKD